MNVQRLYGETPLESVQRYASVKDSGPPETGVVGHLGFVRKTAMYQPFKSKG